MSRDSILPVVGVCIALYAFVVYGEHRRRVAARAAALPRPLQTWEGEGGAVPDSEGAETAHSDVPPR